MHSSLVALLCVPVERQYVIKIGWFAVLPLQNCLQSICIQHNTLVISIEPPCLTNTVVATVCSGQRSDLSSPPKVLDLNPDLAFSISILSSKGSLTVPP